MKIPCLSCQFKCDVKSDFVDPAGKLVRCPDCDYIFMVHRPSLIEEPVAKDTNIDQSILYDLYIVRHELKSEFPVDEPLEESDDYEVETLISIEDFGETAQTESESKSNDFLSDLPDLSEYENMIDWEENNNSEKSSSANRKYNNRIENVIPSINE